MLSVMIWTSRITAKEKIRYLPLWYLPSLVISVFWTPILIRHIWGMWQLFLLRLLWIFWWLSFLVVVFKTKIYKVITARLFRWRLFLSVSLLQFQNGKSKSFWICKSHNMLFTGCVLNLWMHFPNTLVRKCYKPKNSVSRMTTKFRLNRPEKIKMPTVKKVRLLLFVTLVLFWLTIHS